MAEPTIVCPNCRQEIKLTESLAAPLVASARVEFEGKLRAKDVEAAEREKGMREREEAVRRARESVQETVTQQVGVERARIAAEEAKKAKQALAVEMEAKGAALKDLQTALAEKDLKLAEAQKAQAQLLVKERQLEDARREMELTVQKRVSESLAAERTKARSEAEEITKLKLAEKDLRLAEKDQTIAAMKKQVEEAQRKAEQGSQQLQGEVLELQLEALLAGKFPLDRMEAVPKGEHGGDILHRVFGGTTANREIRDPAGASACGTILWEMKRTKNWSDGWLSKLREDQRAAKAEVAVIVSAVLPKGVESFDFVDQVWVTHPRCVLPMALALRSTLVEVAVRRQSAAGQQTKAELVYQYLTGSGFKLRVQAIVEAFTEMQEDLQKERKAIMKQWAKREMEIARVLEATVGLYGDLQGIAGKTMQEIEGLEMPMLEGQHENP